METRGNIEYLLRELSELLGTEIEGDFLARSGGWRFTPNPVLRASELPFKTAWDKRVSTKHAALVLRGIIAGVRAGRALA